MAIRQAGLMGETMFVQFVELLGSYFSYIAGGIVDRALSPFVFPSAGRPFVVAHCVFVF
jgi:hypothetical protein